MPDKEMPDSAWKKRFYAGYLVGPQIASARSDRGIIGGSFGGEAQLYRWFPKEGTIEQFTRVPGGFLAPYVITPDGEYVLYFSDTHGSSIGHYVRQTYGGDEIVDLTPDLPPYPALPCDLNRGGDVFGFVAATSLGFIPYLLNPSAERPEPRQLCVLPSLALGPSLSYDGSLAIVASSERSGSSAFSLLAYSSSGELLQELWDGQGTNIEVAQMAKRPGDHRVLALTDKHGPNTLLIWDPLTNTRQDLVLPQEVGSIQSADWSTDGSRILINAVWRGEQQLYLYDRSADVLQTINMPGTHWRPFLDQDDQIISTHSNAMEPWRPVLIPADPSASPKVLLNERAEIPGAPIHSVRFASKDGTMIQGWLLRPASSGPHPTIIELHGGPADVDLGGYSAGRQALIDAGFALLSVNYRGSTSFGRDYQQAILNRLGELELLDIEAAVQYVCKEGIADPQQIFLMGTSYGGFLSLLALGKLPDLFAGAIVDAAICDWESYAKESDAAGGDYFQQLIGAKPDEDPELYRRISALTYVGNIRAPVLAFHGRNDSRAPASQTEKLGEAMRAAGKEIDIVWYDSGHGSRDVQFWIQQTEMQLAFLNRVSSLIRATQQTR